MTTTPTLECCRKSFKMGKRLSYLKNMQQQILAHRDKCNKGIVFITYVGEEIEKVDKNYYFETATVEESEIKLGDLADALLQQAVNMCEEFVNKIV